MDFQPQLAMWPISGRSLEVEVFQRQLKSSYLHPGGAKHPKPMIHTSRSSWAGVLNGVSILKISIVANFLADLHAQGYQTSSINRSAISSVHDRLDDMDVGKHPLVSRILKGAFHARPPLPHYISTWNVQVVLDCISQ